MVEKLLLNMGLSEGLSHNLQALILFIATLILAYLGNFIIKKISSKIIPKIVYNTKTDIDQIFYENKVFYKITHLVPSFIVHFLSPYILSEYTKVYSFIQDIISIYVTVIITTIILSVIKTLHFLYKRLKIAKDRPIHGYVQVAQIFVYFFAIISILSTLLNKDLTYFLTGLGAIAAILILVFKDTILGFVASIQLSANDMVKIGDWISMPKYGADGDVESITLNTVKVRNWDKTVSTIPTYALVSESFANWRGMSESGGRRIKRHICVDMSTIRNLTNDDYNLYEGIYPILAPYLKDKRKEGAKLTNIGTFRKYIELYLGENPNIHKDMTFLVRHLQPTEKGLPIEIYVFSKDQRWPFYEGIQADIFDHILANIKNFDLKVFQYSNVNV